MHGRQRKGWDHLGRVTLCEQKRQLPRSGTEGQKARPGRLPLLRAARLPHSPGLLDKRVDLHLQALGTSVHVRPS